MEEKRKLGLTAKVLIGFVLGIVLGFIFQEKITVIDPLGQVFLKLVKMIVVPMIFFSIASGIASMSDITKLKKIGLKTILYYTMTTVCAAVIGIVVVNIVHPGAGFDLSQIIIEKSYEATEIPGIGNTLMGMIPDNIINAMAQGNLMQVIVFGVFTGIAIVLVDNEEHKIRMGFDIGTKLMYKITDLVMQFSPIGVCALMACTVGKYGLSVFGPLAKFILCVFGAQLIVLFTVYSIMLKFSAHISLRKFYKEMIPIWLMTISTTSSAGTLPLTKATAESKFGISNKLTSFTLPLGATINMDGAVVFYSIATLFVAQIYGINISLGQQITLVLLTTLISVGSPGIPGGAIVMTTMLLSNMGLPLDIVGMLAGINRIIDMGDTSLNVTGDMVGTLCIARTENYIDNEMLNDRKIIDEKEIYHSIIKESKIQSEASVN